MHAVRKVAATTLLLVMSPTLLAAESTRFDRRLVKEPVYRTKSPKYCLLAFGPKAERRVWLVLDGDFLFADRNGNGDLTDPGERFSPSAFELVAGLNDPKQRQRAYEIGPIVAADGKSRHTLLVRHHERWGETSYTIEVLVRGKFEQCAAVVFASRPADARVAWFEGPLTIRRYDSEGLTRGGKPTTLSFAVAIVGQGTVTFLAYPDLIPEKAMPVATIVFPGKGPGLPLIERTVRFEKRC